MVPQSGSASELLDLPAPTTLPAALARPTAEAEALLVSPATPSATRAFGGSEGSTAESGTTGRVSETMETLISSLRRNFDPNASSSSFSTHPALVRWLQMVENGPLTKLDRDALVTEMQKFNLHLEYSAHKRHSAFGKLYVMDMPKKVSLMLAEVSESYLVVRGVRN